MESISDYLDYEVDENGCWICTSHAPNGRGYPYITVNKKRDGAHRHSYRIHNGNIPKGMVIRHTCDVRMCVNPGHLIVGTIDENVQDRVDRCRSANGRGIHTSKLSDKQVERVIREKDKPASFFAKLFRIDSSAIYRIRNGQAWVQTVKELGLSDLVFSN